VNRAADRTAPKYDPHMPLGEGEVFAGYTVIRPLGSGGMGEVYLVEHPNLPRRDALKILSTAVSADDDYRQRFIREADLAAKLWHPNIVRVNDRGEFNGQLWIAMDYVEGTDAASVLQDRSAGIPADEVAAIVTAIASALDYAHQHGLLHRDVKPGNILLGNPADDERRILLGDFGIASIIGDVSGLTATNMTVGTLPYAAPEQLMDDPMDGRADQYALAATAYHLLTGSPLFPQSNPAAVISRHLNTPPPALAGSHPELAGLDPVLARALAKDPANRFTRCTYFARAFTAATQPGTQAAAAAPTMEAPVTSRPRARTAVPPAPPTKAGDSPPRWPIAVGAIALIAIVFAVAFVVRPWQHDRAISGTSGTPTSVMPSITFNGMRDFVTAYYSDLPTHPNDAWTKLDTRCQNETGLRQFFDFWATIQSVTLISVSPRDATSVVARLTYVRRNGQSDNEDRWFRMTLVNGAMLLDESQRIGPVQSPSVTATSSAALAPPPVAAPTTATPAATQVITVVAVVNGQPANGYREAYNDPSNTLNGCDSSSSAAVSNNIYLCSPYAADADVCWPSPPTTMLCLVDHDPWEKALHRFMWDTAALPPAAPPAQPAPFAVLLDDGTRCKYFYKALGERDDGYYGMYGCGPLDALLAKQAEEPIDRSQPVWTVKVGQVGGQTSHFPPPRTRTVTTAWFAGN
jgi:serine/threonine protein kinase